MKPKKFLNCFKKLKKPTAEQVRLASLLNGKSDDPEINKKIKQVKFFFKLKHESNKVFAAKPRRLFVSKHITLNLVLLL